VYKYRMFVEFVKILTFVKFVKRSRGRKFIAPTILMCL